MKHSLTLLIALLLLLAGRGNAQNETRGSITGRVLDKNTQQPIAGVNVSIPGTQLGATTNDNGVYLIPQVEENIYKLRFAIIGYATTMETDVRVVRKKTTTVREVFLAEEVVNTNDVTVTASSFSGTASAPVSNFSYSREEIRRSPGAAGDILRAIETLPGVSSSGGEFSAFSVRGGSPRENIILVDDIPFENITHFDGGTEDQEAQGGRFSVFAPGLIDNANFQAGGFGAQNNGKLSSLVDLHIKDGGTRSYTANATYDLIGGEVTYDGPSYIDTNTSVLLSARHQDFNTILKLTDQSDMGHPCYTDLILKTTTQLGGGNKLSLLGLYAPETFIRDIDNVLALKKDGNTFDTFIGRQDVSKYLGGINLLLVTGSKSILHTILYSTRQDQTVSAGHAYTDHVNPQDPKAGDATVRDNVTAIDNSETTTGLRSHIAFSFDNHSMLTFGGEISRMSPKYSLTLNGLDTVYTFGPNDTRPDPSKMYLVHDPAHTNSSYNDAKMMYGSFAEYSFRPLAALTLTGGARYDYNGFNGQSALDPRLSAQYQFAPGLAFNAAYGVYHQPAELRLIARDARNALTNDERSSHYIAGVSAYLTDDIKFTVEGYYKDLGSLLVRTDRYTQLLANNGTGWSRGIDFGLVKRFVDRWYGQLNYSYSASKRDDHDGLGEYDADFSQPHIFNVLVGYEINNEWTVSTKWKYSSGRPKDSYIIHSNVFNDPNFVRYSKEITGNNTDRLPDFHTWNVRVDYRHQFGTLAVVAFVDILNVYGRLNVNEERFLESTGTTELKGFRIIPTMGAKFEF